MKRTIIFVRHGKAAGTDGYCVGQTDPPLAREGEDAIRSLSAHLVTNWLTEDHRKGTRDNPIVISSDLRRASESAAIVGRALGIHPSHDVRLREMHFGEWDGRLWTDVERSDGERLRAWMEDWRTLTPPGGESLDDLVRRAEDWIVDVVRANDDKRTLVAVSHAGFIRAAICCLTGHPVDRLFDLPIDHAHATIIRLGMNVAEIVASNAAEGGVAPERHAP